MLSIERFQRECLPPDERHVGVRNDENVPIAIRLVIAASPRAKQDHALDLKMF
jgi:hypothetical protein